MRSELQNIIDVLSSKVGVATSLTDPQFNSIVFGPHHDTQIDVIRRQALLNRQTAPDVRAWFESFGTATATAPVRIPADPAMQAMSRLIVPVRGGTILYGYVCLLDDEYRLGDTEMAIVNDTPPEIARFLLRQHRDRQRGAELLYGLLSTSPSERDEAAAEIGSLSVYPKSAIVLLRFSPDTDELVIEREIDDILRRATSTAQSVMRFVEAGRAVFLVRSRTQPQAAALAHHVLEHCHHLNTPGHTVAAGVGDEYSDLTVSSVSWEHAELAARVAAAAHDTPDRVAEWSKLGAMRVLATVPPTRLRELIDPRFGPLTTAEDPTLIATLETYLDCAANAQRTAQALNVHRNTLYYRLRKAQEISGFDLADGEDVLALHLALKAHRLVRGVGAELEA